MVRTGSAVWQGTLREGNGALSTESGVLRASPYSFRSRFESEPATNPEELIAAAHAGCFSMAFSAQLQAAGLTPERIETTARVSLEKVGAEFEVTASRLEVLARVPGASREAFDRAAAAAKEGCPISKLLRAEISLEARLEG
ncbi:MAG TPA: OsmC family protein [Acidobacteriota bacterium]|nr:OsmC family protein [Acidobacteriota bacterium]